MRMLHPRAIVAGAAAADGDDLRFAIDGLVPWRPAPLALDRASVATLGRVWRGLVADLTAFGAPGGFGALLVGAPLAFPLEGARRDAEDLAAGVRARRRARGDGRRPRAARRRRRAHAVR